MRDNIKSTKGNEETTSKTGGQSNEIGLQTTQYRTGGYTVKLLEYH